MEAKIINHAFALADVYMKTGESLYLLPGAMASMRGSIKARATLGGGSLLKAYTRKYAKQSSVMSKYTAHSNAILSAAPDIPGDIAALKLEETGPLRVEAGALLGYQDTVSVTASLQKMKKFFMGNSMIGSHLDGSGLVLIAGYGGLRKVTLRPGETFIVNDGFAVAWSANMPMKFGPMDGLVSSALTKEGFVGQFEGPGTILLQTRQRLK